MNENGKPVKFRHRLEYLGVLFISAFARLLPDRIMYFLADRLGDFAYYVVGMRKAVTLENLESAFPEKDRSELQIIARDAYRGFSRMIFDYSRMPRINTGTIDNYVESIDISPLMKHINSGRGVLILSGHFGSWEMCGGGLALKGFPLSFLVGEQHNRLVDDMMNNLRRSAGLGIIHLGVALRGVIKELKNARAVALLVDQDAGRDGTFVEFFGRPASTPKGPAAFALKTKASVFMMSAVRLKNGKHNILFEEIPAEGLDEADPVRDFTQRYTFVLEKHIRAHPDHYFWMHRRWKTRPENQQV